MSSTCVVSAKDEFDASLDMFQSLKSTVSLWTSGSTLVGANREQLESLSHDFEKSLQDLNRTWTIWRNRYQEAYGMDAFIKERFSESWLEGQWYEYSDLYDPLDETVYSMSLNSSSTSGGLLTTTPVDSFYSTSGGSLNTTPVDSSSSTSGGSLNTTPVDSSSSTSGGSLITTDNLLSGIWAIIPASKAGIIINNPLTWVPAARIYIQPSLKPPLQIF